MTWPTFLVCRRAWSGNSTFLSLTWTAGVRPLLRGTRSDSGVVVVAQIGVSNALETGLETGDIIRAVDRTALQTTAQFETLVRNLRSGDPVVLQVERKGKLQYLAFEME